MPHSSHLVHDEPGIERQNAPPCDTLFVMRLLTLSILSILFASAPAFAQHHRGGRTIVRGHGSVSVSVGGSFGGHRDRGGTVVRGQRGGTVVQRYSGQVSHDRRVVYRRPLYHNNGRFTFHNGQTVVYRRPVIRDQYYDYRVRPQPIVESYPNQNGYIWVNGSWSWNGYEWTWTAGYYAPDPNYQTYYSDGSYDTYDSTYDDGY